MVRSSIPNEYEKKMEELNARETKLSEQESNGIDVSAEKDLLEMERVEFLLRAGPFIQKYYDHDKNPGNTDSQMDSSGSSRGIAAFLKIGPDDTRGELYDEYMYKVEGQIDLEAMNKRRVTAEHSMSCDECGTGMIIDNVESQLVCPKCGIISPFLECTSKNVTYEQEQTYQTTVNFAYKRSNHLSEHLACFQGKESTSIPPEVLESIRAELKKYRITDSKQVTAKRVRELLKKLKLQKYYEHTQLITYELNGIHPPTIDQETEEKFKQLFNDIQGAFHKVCPKTRKNFLSYSYVLRKLSQLLNRDDLVPFFPLLKSRDKLYQQDQIWKAICNELKYEFIPSM